MVPGFGEIAERLRRSTVTVAGSGSGVVWSADGSVITNAHVARGPRAAVENWEGKRWEAEVAARHPRRDLAWLRVNAVLEAPVFADSSQVQPGELVLAIGNPLGFTGALSTGVVHAVGPVAGLGRRPWIQAGVRLAPGNSGGPLADSRGRVIGINAMVAGGIGLAIPSNTVADFMRTGGETVRLGVVVRPVAAGLLVLEVERGSRAAAAALEPGDLLVGADGRRFEYLDDLGEALENARGRVRLQFVRGDRLRDAAA